MNTITETNKEVRLIVNGGNKAKMKSKDRPLIVHVQGKLWPRILLVERKDSLVPKRKGLPARRRRRGKMERSYTVDTTISVGAPDVNAVGCSSPSSYSDIPSLVGEIPKECRWTRCTMKGREVVVTGKQWFRIVHVKEMRNQKRKAQKQLPSKETEISIE